MIRRFQWGVGMRGTRLRSKMKSAVAILCAACFLFVGIGTVSSAVAADTWETWLKKPAEPGVEPTPGPDGAAQAGDAAGTKTYAGMSAGTIGWIAAGTAVIIGIAVAAGGGGGGGSSSNH